MINFSLICKSNYWPARVKKIYTIVKKILIYQDQLKFSNSINYNCNLILTEDVLIKKMNFKFRKKNYSTNVLTFVSDINLKKIKKTKICDIFLSANFIKKEANFNNITFYDHFSHLLIHSFLHINGYDHKKNKDFIKMKKIEIMILNKLGIANPYLIFYE